MPRIVSVEKAAYSVSNIRTNYQIGYRAISVPYSVPVGTGRTVVYYRTEYRPDNKFSVARDSSSDIEYWLIELDDGQRIHTAWYLCVPEPQVGDEFQELVVASMPIWVKIGDRKTYSNVVIGGIAITFSCAVTWLWSKLW